jgi:acetyltransferase-like isoleucine patch superfamily enzyme
MNKLNYVNPIARLNSSFYPITYNEESKINNNLGLRSTTILCHEKIEIDDNVKIDENFFDYYTDFQNLKPLDRLIISKKIKTPNKYNLIIDDNVFIVLQSTILEEVAICENIKIGICSDFTNCVTENQICTGISENVLKKLESIK